MTGKNAPTTRKQCGTYRGWNLHSRNFEYPCDDCRDAATIHTRVWRIKTSQIASLNIPIEVLQAVAHGRAQALQEYLAPAVFDAVHDWKPKGDIT